MAESLSNGVKPHPRPLSPHLQVYKPQLTSITSILHRFSGIALSAGVLYLLCWLLAVAGGAETFDRLQDFNGSLIGRLLLLGWSVAFFYHLLNGIRHLAWDAGFGFELPAAYRSGYAVLIGTAVLTIAAWVIGYFQMGAF
ncbi:succinate dehydrogenase, cytochrome b556 subunit [Dongia mobilis]|jgi:succinate dehydrogenase / fumarate reductase cytochrome b subunit|uniref:succinate dehydrogenase, cytochrome b556 subunit n=1 Tax=Dongia sp. TaxID=1977262 RepID=UPI0026EE22A4